MHNPPDHLLLPTIVASLALAFPLAAQQASYTIVGASCTTGRISAQIGPVPLRAIGTPRLGTTFSIETESTASYPWGNRRTVLLLTGVSNTAAGGVPLPFDISVLSPNEPFCGQLRTSLEVIETLPRQTTHATPSQVHFTVPNAPWLLGATFFQQVLSIETTTFGPPFRSWALSAGGQAIIGF
jgi:hypothetical protein